MDTPSSHSKAEKRARDANVDPYELIYLGENMWFTAVGDSVYLDWLYDVRSPRRWLVSKPEGLRKAAMQLLKMADNMEEGF